MAAEAVADVPGQPETRMGTVKEIARITRMSESTIRRRLRSGDIPHRRSGNCIRIQLAWADDFTGWTPQDAA